MKFLKKVIPVVLFLLFSCINVQGQIKIFRTLSVEDGLVQSYVESIFQDSRGYMWFGTFHGLSRWDGINFKNYYTINGLAGADISCITEDNRGRLLVGTDQGLTIIDNWDFINYTAQDGLHSSFVYSLMQDSNKDIYIATHGGLNLLRGDSLLSVSENTMIADKPVVNMVEGDGEMIILVRGIGLVKYSSGSYSLVSNDPRFSKVKMGNSFLGRDGVYYFSTPDGFCKYDGEELNFINLRTEVPGINVRNIYEGDKGKIFIASDSGVIIYDNGISDIIDEKNGLPTNRIMTVSKDINGIYYFGTQAEGVALYNGGRIFTLNRETGLHSNRIYGISSIGKTIYIAAAGSGINVYNYKEKIKTISPKNGLPSNAVLDLFTSSNDVLYASTTKGVAIIKDNKVTRILSKKDGLNTNQARGLTEDADGKIYLGTNDGLNIWDGHQFESIKQVGDKKINRINDVFVNPNGVIYLATEKNGLIKINPDRSGEIIDINSGLANNKVMSVHENSEGVLFAGTQGGLTIFYKEKIETLNTINGLSDNTIYCIGEDNYGRIYLTTNKGVNILNLSEEEISIRTLTFKNGLAGDECNSFGLHRDIKGRMWFGTLRGISCYYPHKNKYEMKPPLVRLTGLKLHEKSYKPFYFGKDLVFEHDENYLRFNFIGVNLAAPEQMRYQYRLTNVDPNWVETSYRFARYADLKEGEYLFEVRAKNEGGHWSEPVGTTFIINGPFWESWWFISFIILFVGGTVALVIVFRIRQLIAVERLRTKLAADLHDNIGAGLTEISIMSEVISQASDRNNEHATSNLSFISRTARELVDSMSDIVWLVNPKRDSLYDLIIRLEETYRELLTQKGIAFQSKNLTSLESISLPMDYRQNLYLIFKEAMNNSLKYSNCTNLFLNANVDGKKIEMSLKDNGKGFNPDVVEKNSYGVKNMYERAGKIDGALDIVSSENNGTEILFTGKII